jgi:tetratricopeptide (TPR) repeat protein/tRNA A-37 threonylcarbamoyl transferase component Bud32
MREPQTTLTPAERERTRAVREIIDGITRARRAGQRIDDDAIERAHPDLMPELSDALRTLRAVADAARKARGLAAAAPPDTAAHRIFGEDIGFLRATLTNYEILEPLDHGGQAIVYKALQRSTRRTVAIKVLLDGPLATEHQRRRFAREVEVISRLRHPNIVTLFDSGTVRNRAYFAMEYVEGVPVDDYVLLHNQSVVQILRLFVTVCRAVSHAHQHGVIHRDLGPDNILVDLAGNPRILDFGLAKDVWDGAGPQERVFRTVPGQVFGKLPYLSPEQAGGLDMQVDVRSDLYTLGVVLFKILAGRFPYDVEGNVAAVQSAIISEPPMLLRKAISPAANVPNAGRRALLRDLEMILLKALAKDKAARYQSAAAFADDLERCLAGDVVEARADNRFYLLQRVARRYRWAVSIGALFLLLLGSSAAAVTVLWAQARTQRDTARETARLALATLDDVVKDIDESVSSLAGGMPVRDRLLNEVVASRLEQLQPLVESDVAMEDVRGGLREKQGDIAYAEGLYEKAAEHYRDFLRISEARLASSPTNDGCLADVARAHRKLADVVDEAEAHFERAVELNRTRVANRPDALDAKYALCEALVAFGRYHARRAYFEQAAPHVEAALDIANRVVEVGASDAHWRTLLARAYEWDGDIRIQLAQAERSRASLEASLALREALLAEQPASIDLRHALMLSCMKLATRHRDTGNSTAAITLFERSTDEGEYLVKVDPSVATWKRDLQAAYEGLAWLLTQTGDLDRALSCCNRTLELAEILVDSAPTNVEWRRVLALALAHRGAIWLSRDAPERARDDFEAARAMGIELLRARPDDLALHNELAYTQNRLGRCFMELNDTDQSLVHYARAVEIYASLLDRQPDLPQRELDLVHAQINLALALLARDTRETNVEAMELFQRAEQSLVALQQSHDLGGHEGKVTRWLAAVQHNLRICTKRISSHAQANEAQDPNSADAHAR